MITKLEAAESAALSGAATVVCNGAHPDVLSRVAAGERVGTLFLPGERLKSRKHWLAFTTRTRGALVIDDGAIDAVVRRGRSLLPAGIQSVQGEFGIGDAVRCVDTSGHERARGLVAYSSRELARIVGLPTDQIVPVLGYTNGTEVIHRDDLVVITDAPER
jgi:glutamate 5-kinase